MILKNHSKGRELPCLLWIEDYIEWKGGKYRKIK